MRRTLSRKLPCALFAPLAASPVSMRAPGYWPLYATYSWLAKNRSRNLVAIEDIDGGDDNGRSGVALDSATTYNPESALMAKVDAVRLEAAIGALPMEFREVLILREVQGLEYREIADVIGIPIGTVMSRLARTRRRLMDAIRTDHA